MNQNQCKCNIINSTLQYEIQKFNVNSNTPRKSCKNPFIVIGSLENILLFRSTDITMRLYP